MPDRQHNRVRRRDVAYHLVMGAYRKHRDLLVVLSTIIGVALVTWYVVIPAIDAVVTFYVNHIEPTELLRQISDVRHPFSMLYFWFFRLFFVLLPAAAALLVGEHIWTSWKHTRRVLENQSNNDH